MSKIEPFNSKWTATAALTCALDETEPDEQVIVIVRKKGHDSMQIRRQHHEHGSALGSRNASTRGCLWEV